ncbi:MAG: T9SS type A sorting domain-containing protein [Chitinophagaceae bacterium]
MYAQAGTLDPTFGDSGLKVVNALTNNNKSHIQSDGKIIMLSSENILDRFNPDGSYDESFGINGRSEIDFHGKLYTSNNNFTLQSDGKIVCIGEYYSVEGKIFSGVFRCKPDGSLDSSFGNNGMDSVHIDNLNYPSGIVVQPDGKIVVAGDVRKSIYDEKRTFIYRLMSNGGLDSGFGNNGIVVNLHSKDINSVDLVIRPNGKLVIGSTYEVFGFRSAYQLESFNSDGTVDENFGVNGIGKFYFGDGQTGIWNTEMHAMTLESDGKIVCAGITGVGDIVMGLCRFYENGNIDEGFGENGGVITPYMNIDGVQNFGVTFQPDGKILTCGYALMNSNTPIPLILVRYSENGNLDPEFGDNGITATTNDSSSIGGYSIHVLPDGKILVTGGSTGPYILLARYNGDNVLAANFKEVKATQTNDAITITWQTLNESGTKSFTVERSNNANDYAGINTVPAKGVASSYSYTDKNPLSGTNYYRIRENAANGTNTFSPVVKVVFNDNGIISLYPNPAKNTVTVKGLNKNTIATIRITDMNGREISKQNFTQSNIATLNIRALAQGSYFVLVEQNGKVTKLRIVKE